MTGPQVGRWVRPRKPGPRFQALNFRGQCDQAARAAVAAARHLLHLPKPGNRASGLPSPVLKLAWQRRQTYIFELDIIGLTPGSPEGRAATYSAWVWRSLRAALEAAAGAEEGTATAGPLDGGAERRAVMGRHLKRFGGGRMQDACAVR